MSYARRKRQRSAQRNPGVYMVVRRGHMPEEQAMFNNGKWFYPESSDPRFKCSWDLGKSNFLTGRRVRDLTEDEKLTYR